jgi:hypothetical protein
MLSKEVSSWKAKHAAVEQATLRHSIEIADAKRKLKLAETEAVCIHLKHDHSFLSLFEFFVFAGKSRKSATKRWPPSNSSTTSKRKR